MLLYYQLWMFMGFIIHFYIIFGTNLEPSASFCFFLVLEYRRKGKSNGVQLTWNFTELIFGMEAIQETWSRRQGSFKGGTKQGGAPYPLGAPPPSWASWDSPGPSPILRGLLLVQKKVPWSFRSIGLRLIFLFRDTLKRAKKTETGTGL